MKLGHKTSNFRPRFRHQTSDFSPRFIHQPANIIHLTDCEELVKVLVHRCKKLDENGSEK